MYINDNWCRQYTVRETTCSPDVELLCLSLRPAYLPRELGNIILCAVYVPPSGNAASAAAYITDCVQQQLRRCPEAPVFILGDLNHCKLELSLPGFHQYVKCGTRGDRILDKCFGNVENAYVSRAKPPLSNSDHKTIHLIPTYKTALKRRKPLRKTVKVWTEDTIETLKGCFQCTEWNIFHRLDVDTAAETVTDYIQFCVDNTIPKKEITVYPNNKSYITKEVKDCIN